jgi:hypothetical protein
MKMNKGGNQQNENFLEMGSVPTLPDGITECLVDVCP